jgi:hypothetical protein
MPKPGFAADRVSIALNIPFPLGVANVDEWFGRNSLAYLYHLYRSVWVRARHQPHSVQSEGTRRMPHKGSVVKTLFERMLRKPWASKTWATIGRNTPGLMENLLRNEPLKIQESIKFSLRRDLSFPTHSTHFGLAQKKFEARGHVWA